MSWWIDWQKKLLWKMDQLYTTRWTSCIQQDAKIGDYNGREGKWTAYVATAVDEYSAGGSDQSLFSVSEE